MSSGFPAGYPDFFTSGGVNNAGGRSIININNPQGSYRSPLSGILPDVSSQFSLHRRSDLIGKRSLAEFQQQQAALYLRNVKPRPYQQTSPISPLSPMDFSASISPEISSVSNTSSASSISARYGVPVFQQQQQLRQQRFNLGNGTFNAISTPNNNYSSLSLPNLAVKQAVNQELLLGRDSEKKMMNHRLQELEKELLDDDNEDEEGDAVSVVTNSEWSETFQNLLIPSQTQKPEISPSPTSSSSSCSSSSASTATICPNQSITDTASAISDGKSDSALEILTRLNSVSNVRGTPEQRLMAYMASALRSRVITTDQATAELYGEEHMVSTKLLYDKSPCFKLAFMAANNAILDAVSDRPEKKIHVLDFDICQGVQYVYLLHEIASRQASRKIASVKLTAFADGNGIAERLKLVGDRLNELAKNLGVCFYFNVLSLKISNLTVESLGLESDESLAVNFGFKLYRLPDESVTTENLRDDLLRRVKRFSPKVVTVVEQEMNGNTAPFVARVNEASVYYGALFDSLEATFSRENSERVRIEEGLSRKMANSVACEGRARVERCEVFGKWRVRMRMAGFEPKPLSQLLADSLRSRLNSETRGNPGFTVKEDSGGICFGWMGRNLTVASAWL